jgi:hypothetical protein
LSHEIRFKHPCDAEYWLRVGVSQIALLVCANLTELAISQRLREDAVVDEAESIPLGRAFGFEVPEYPAINFVSTVSQSYTKADP